MDCGRGNVGPREALVLKWVGANEKKWKELSFPPHSSSPASPTSLTRKAPTHTKIIPTRPLALWHSHLEVVAEIEAALAAAVAAALAVIVEDEEAVAAALATEEAVEEDEALATAEVVEVGVDEVAIEDAVEPEVVVAVELVRRVECKSIHSSISRISAKSFAGGSSLSPIVTRVSLSPAARKICSSPRTSRPASPSTAKSEFPSPTPRPAMMARQLPLPSTACGIPSDPRSQLVSWAVSTTSLSSRARKFCTSVLRLAHPSPTLPILLALRAPSTLLSSHIDQAVI